MLIVRFAMLASSRVRWNFAIRRGGDRRERDVAEVLLDEAEPFLIQLDRARGAPHPRGIQVGADRILKPLRPLFVGFVVPRRFRYRRPATVKSVQH